MVLPEIKDLTMKVLERITNSVMALLFLRYVVLSYDCSPKCGMFSIGPIGLGEM